ncbi:MAG TPA: hypothetical protein VFP58_03350 [Candidatus Eisenbacteria bacterium]|nr:hypothetical protein [Candidatus Eisenbacteria bacterium]
MPFAPLLLAGSALAASVLACAGCASSGGGEKPVAASGVVSVAAPGAWGAPAALESLRAGGVAVLGAVQVDEVDQVRPPLIAALDSVLAARWAGVPILRHARVRAALDDSTARLLLLGYQLHGRAEPLWLGRAADALADSARYGVLARVRTKRVRTEDRETERVDRSSRGVEIRVTILESDVSLHLYDLATRGLVCSGEITGYAERGAPSDSLPMPERPPLQDWSTPEDRAREAMTAPTMLYLEPPPLVWAVRDAMAAFADSVVGSGDRGVPRGR